MPDSERMPTLLTTAQVAERLNLSIDYTRLLLRTGAIPSTRPGGREYRVEPADLEAYIHPQTEGDE